MSEFINPIELELRGMMEDIEGHRLRTSITADILEAGLLGTRRMNVGSPSMVICSLGGARKIARLWRIGDRPRWYRRMMLRKKGDRSFSRAHGGQMRRQR